MNRYSKKSVTLLNQCHPDIQLIFSVVLQSWDHTVLTGHRNEKDQTIAFVSKASKLRWPLSKHNSTPSMATDISPFPIPKKWGQDDQREYEKFRYFSFYVLGVADMLYEAGEIKHRLRWGGDWDGDKDVNDQNFNDLVHFELIGEYND